jgi:HSP20 family protein
LKKWKIIGGEKTLSEDSWSRWFKKNPFFGNSFDINETFKEIQEIFTKEFGEISKGTSNTRIREETLPDGTQIRSFGPFVYGYSMTMGPDGKPKVTKFGNMPGENLLEKPQPETKQEREPLTDIIEADDKIKVIVELHGVEKENIKLSGTEDKLTISVDVPERKYFKEIELPAKVKIGKATSHYKNGVLDVTIPKTKRKKAKKTSIKIE